MPTTCADVVGRLCHLSTTDAEKASPVTPCPLKWFKGAQWGAALGKGSVGRPLAMGRKQPILRPQQISLESQGKKMNSMSKAQLTAFLAKVEATPALKLQVDAAADASAVIAQSSVP